MSLDLATLSLVAVFVTALVGLLLVFSWWQNRSVEALAWWGASYVVAALGWAVLVGRHILPAWLSIGAGNALMFAAFGLFWAGCRIFERRPVPATAVAAGAFLWVAACGIPDVYRSFGNRVALASMISGSYALCAAWRSGAGAPSGSSRATPWRASSSPTRSWSCRAPSRSAIWPSRTTGWCPARPGS